jgi:hypothetical protein
VGETPNSSGAARRWACAMMGGRIPTNCF